MPAGNIYLLERDQLHARQITRLLQKGDFTVHRLEESVPPMVAWRRAVLLVNVGSARTNLLDLLGSALQGGAAGCIALGVEPTDAEMLDAAQSGFSSFVDLNYLDRDLLRAIEQVAAGGVWLPRRVLRRLLEAHARQQIRRHAADGHRRVLTVREEEVLSQLLEGRSYKEIGHSLSIVERTVKAHVAHLLAKFQVANRHELAARLRSKGYF